MGYELQTIESSQNKKVLTTETRKVLFLLNDSLQDLAKEMKKNVVELGGGRFSGTSN